MKTVFASVKVFLALALLCMAALARAESLPAMNASRDDLSVSGLSSGAFMSVQMHVAHSSLVRGVGVLAGGPYYCAQNSATRAVSNCMNPGWWRSLPSLESLTGYMQSQAQAGNIDELSNLSGTRVWLLSGGADKTVRTEVVDSLYGLYAHYLPASSILYERLPNAGHAMIESAPDANACELTASPYINRCGNYDAAGRLLRALLGELQPRGEMVEGALRTFNQQEFTSGSGDAGLAPTGYVYVPQACHQGECRIHVVFHGCQQQAEKVGETFVRETGYNDWAETNRLIILYPQIKKSLVNPNGCWDWWGYTGSDYALKSGKQIKAVIGMIDRLTQVHPFQEIPVE